MPSKLTMLRSWLTMCLLLFASFAFAQKALKGKVIIAGDNTPASGATVSVKGTNIATQTAADGSFTINVPNENSVLLITYVGFDDLEVATEGRSSVEATLMQSAGSLNEIVVTGYTSQKKKDLTGAVAVVNVEDMVKQPSPSINSQLQGQASGVTVLGSGQPGEEPTIRIRGFNSFGNNTPLYVVDGVPTQNISDINPNDVGTMQVLKDAGAASIYGSRANNGVIIITTKKGNGKVKVNYDAFYGTQRPKSGNVWETLTPQEMADLKWMALKNTNNDPISDILYGNGATPTLPDYITPAGASEGDPSVDPSLYNVDPNYTDADAYNGFYRITKANKAGTDWFHEIFEPAPIQSHNIQVSGGSSQGNYLFSMNYFNQQGTLINTYLKRYTIRSNSSFKVGNNIRIGENLSYSYVDNPRIGALSEGSAIGHAFREQPIIPVHDIMGNYAGSFSTGGAQLGNANNPVAIQERTINNTGQGLRLFGNVFADIEILKMFTFHSSFGGEVYSGYSHSFSYPNYENAENSNVNSYSENSYNGNNWTWSNTLQFQRNFNNVHDVKVLVGTEAYEQSGRSLGGSTASYFSFNPNFTNLTTGSGTPTNYSNGYEEALFSTFARVDYAYQGKYLIGATVRRDGSSKFGANYRWGTFPAASAGWRISEENFMKNVTWLSDLKIRGSYGIMGSQFNIGAGNAFSLFGQDKNSTYYDIRGTNNSIDLGFSQSTIGNENTKWESDVNANFGFDASILNGKFNITADYYRKDIKDLLYSPELPGTAGSASAPTVNIANIKSSGFDASIGAHLDFSKDWSFDALGTFTTYNTEIKKISGANNDYFDAQARRFNGAFIIRNAVGHPISSYYGYQVVGFWDDQAEIDAANEEAQKATGDPVALYQTDVKVGRFRYADNNKDGHITDDDRSFIGSPNPNFTYGLNLGVTYKAFEFSIFLYGTQGNDIWNNIRWWTDFYGSFAGAKSKTALYDSWRPDHKNAKVAIQENSGSFSTNSVPNSYFVEKGSYLRAKNVQLGYTIPSEKLTRFGINRLKVYVQAANLFTITKYSGIDPEITGGTAEFGIDEGAYPNQRQFLVGLNLSF